MRRALLILGVGGAMLFAATGTSCTATDLLKAYLLATCPYCQAHAAANN